MPAKSDRSASPNPWTPGKLQSARCHPVAQCGRAGLGFELLLEVAADESSRMGAFCLHHAGIDRVNADLPRSQFLRQDVRDGIHSALGGGIDDRRGRRDPRRRRADINDASTARFEQFRVFLSRPEKAKHIRVELLMELIFPDLSERCELYTPALFTNTSSFPNARLVLAKRRWISDAFLTSP